MPSTLARPVLQGTTAEKKRKRSSAAANSGFSEEQLERLQVG